jgi:integrase
LKERKVAPSTWNRRRASLIVFVDWAMEKDLLNADPMDGVAKMKVEELPPEWLDEQQFRSLVRRLDQDVNRALSVSEYEMRKALMYRAAIALMLYAGLRVGEVVALVPDDLDINERSGKVIVRDGKGEKHREVPLSLKARKALTAWLEWKDWNEPGNPLWYGRKGDPLGVRAIQDYVKQLGHVLEIEMTPHSFRHTFGKRLADKGVPVPYIQKLMGHASMETTARYIQAGWDDLVDATESL